MEYSIIISPFLLVAKLPALYVFLLNINILLKHSVFIKELEILQLSQYINLINTKKNSTLTIKFIIF